MLAPTRTAVQAELKASLLDSADVFRDEAWPRLVDAALAHLSSRQPRHGRCELELVADRADYPAPADLMRVRAMLWGLNYKAHRPAWEPGNPGMLPEASVIGGPGDRSLLLNPAPTAAQIAVLGTRCPILYAAAHVLTEDPDDCTLSSDQLAGAIGMDAFLTMWRIIDADDSRATHDDDGSVRIRFRPYSSYRRFQRNLFIRQLADMGIPFNEIRARVRDQMCENLDKSYMRRILKGD